MPQNLTPVVVSTPDDPKFTPFHAIFDKGGRFEGYETTDALKEYMVRNTDAELQKKVGPAKEMWIGLQNEQGIIVGAINQQVFVHKDGNVTAQHSYVMAGQNVMNAKNQPIEFSKDELKNITDKLYAEADKQAVQFAKDNGVANPKIYTFAVENHPLDATPQYLKDHAEEMVADNSRLKNAGFKNTGVPYTEVLKDENGKEQVSRYDLHTRLPEGVKEIPTGLIKEHIQSKYIPYSFEVSTDNPNFKNMNAALDKSGSITPQPIADMSKLVPNLVEKMDKIPAETLKGKEEMPVGAVLATQLMDKNGNGIVSGEEASRFANHVKDMMFNAGKGDKKAQEFMEKLDLDGNGRVNANDVERLKAAVGGNVDKQYLNRISDALKKLPGQEFPVANVGQENSAQLPSPQTGQGKPIQQTQQIK